MKRISWAAGLVAVISALAVSSPAAALAGTLDQQQTDSSGGSVGIASAGSAAQTFTAGISGNLDQVDLDLEDSGNPDPLVVEIRDVSGVPGNKVLASNNVPGTAVPSLPAFVPVKFNPPAAVASGTQYAIVAYTSGVSLYRWEHSPTGNPYPGGLAFTSSFSPPSGFWTSAINDFAFKTYVVPATATPAGVTGQRAAALKKCKKKHTARARKKCRKKSKLLPV